MSRSKALVSNIQHFCVHDGNGFRTTVFLQGCPLKCRWCHNPELQTLYPIHMYNAVACEHCMECVDSCSKEALFPQLNGFRPLDTQICQECVSLKIAPCVDACVYGVRSLSSIEMSAEDVFIECLKERAFWADGGGITLSGGEPLLWKDFCCEIGRLCCNQEVNLAVETCGYVQWENFEQIIEAVNTFLYDLKLVTHDLRYKWLGVNAELDIENLRRLVSVHNHVVVRVPLIPGINDTENEFAVILSEIVNLKGITDIQLMPFHQLGSTKYKLAGMTYSMIGKTEENDEAIARCRSMAEAAGLNVDIGGKAFTNSREV